MPKRFYRDEIEKIRAKWPEIRNGVYLYILLDPITNEPRYVGQTNNPYRRLVKHIRDFGGTRLNSQTKDGWLARLYFQRLIPKMEIIAIVEKRMADKQELALIGSYLCSGIDLLNIVRKRRIT